MWIEDYRIANGLELDEFAHRVNVIGKRMKPPLYGCVSDTLIYKLERSKSPRTHPRIADAIARVCGATDEQRDSIVDESHRGKREQIIVHVDVRSKENQNGKRVFRLDRDGNVDARYASISEAARENRLSCSTIYDRCNRRVKYDFLRFEHTYRFADDWEAMTDEQKMAEMEGA